MGYGDESKRQKGEQGVKMLFDRIDQVGEQGQHNAETLDDIRVLLSAISQALSSGAAARGDVDAAVPLEPETVEVTNPRDQLTNELRVLYDNIVANRELCERKFGEGSAAAERLLKESEEIGQGVEHLKTQLREVQRDLQRAPAPEPDMFADLGMGRAKYPEQEFMAEMAQQAARAEMARGGRPSPRHTPMQQMRQSDEMEQLSERMAQLEAASQLSEDALKETIKKVASVGMNVNEVLARGVEAASGACENAERLAEEVGGQTGRLAAMVRASCGLSAAAVVIGLVNLLVMLMH